MKIDSAVFYTTWLEAIEELPNEQEQLNAFMAIHRYQAYHEEPDVKGTAKIIFMMAKPIIDDLYNRRVSNIENGKKGGRPRRDQSGEEPEDKSKPMVISKKTDPFSEKNLYENENDNGNENENDINTGRKKRFVKPTIEEIRSYCGERDNTIDPDRFFNYYESNGWKVGKNPMKDWKACVRTWEQNNPKPQEERKEAEKLWY